MKHKKIFNKKEMIFVESKSQEKYLTMAFQLPSKYFKGISQSDIAAMLEIKTKSLWYFQIRGWIQNPPEQLSQKTKILFQQESKLFLESIENDYQIPESYESSAFLLITDFLNLIEQLRNKTLYVVSAWIPIVGAVILSNSKKSTQKNPSKEMSIKTCLCFDCEQSVDLRKKKSGACCIEHTRFFCKRCKCWHHYGTKIAKEHQEFKAFNWIKNKVEREKVLQEFSQK